MYKTAKKFSVFDERNEIDNCLDYSCTFYIVSWKWFKCALTT